MRCDNSVVAVLALAASAVLFGGCAAGSAPSPPPPATDAERDEALERYYDTRWAELQSIVPGLERPPLDRVEVVEDDEWSGFIELCIGEYAASVDSDRAFQIALLACQEQYPSQSLFESIKSEAELDYLYTWYAEFVEPCLVLSGFAIPPRPSKEEFYLGGGYTWNVYQGNRSTTDNLKQLLLDKCPPPPERRE
jgi:hypothetical protein